jgi:predicted esterase
MLAGGIPVELGVEDFKFLNGKTKVSFIYGNHDEYITTKFMVDAKQRFYELFGNDAQIITFDGKHEVPKKLINQLVED